MAEGSKIVAVHSPNGYVQDIHISRNMVGSTTTSPKEVFMELFQTHYIREYCGIRLWNENCNPNYLSQRKNGLIISPNFSAIQNLNSLRRMAMSRARRPPERNDWAYLRREARYLVGDVLLDRRSFAEATSSSRAHNNGVATKEIIDVFSELGYVD